MRPKGWCVPVLRGTRLAEPCKGIKCVGGGVSPSSASGCFSKLDWHDVSLSLIWKGLDFGEKVKS